VGEERHAAPVPSARKDAVGSAANGLMVAAATVARSDASLQTVRPKLDEAELQIAAAGQRPVARKAD
jgi:hypothetical protein